MLGILGLGIVAAISCLKPPGDTDESAVSSAGGEVHGSLFASISGRQVFVPDLTVELRSPSTNAVLATTRTDLTGHFSFRRQVVGRYRLCWIGTGVPAACSTSLVSVGNVTAYAGAIAVSPALPMVSGKVTLKDGAPCYAVDPFFGVDAFTRVQALSSLGSQLVPPVRANSLGEFVVGGIPAVGATPKLRFTCESLSVEQSFPATGGTVNQTLPNTAPRLVGVAAFASGVGVRVAAAGSTVDVRADASDEGVVHFRWRVEQGAGTATSSDVAQIPWTLPTRPGRYTLHVLAYDGRGGYASDRVSLVVGAAGASFSGKVVDAETRAPLANASIVVSGAGGSSVSGASDTSGSFYIRNVPYSQRYTLNISRTGYAPASRIFDGEGLGGVYSLLTAQQTTEDPRGTIDVTDHRPDLERRQVRGARIVLAPGSLDTSAPVTVSISTVDPSFRGMPGDYRATDAAGAAQSLTSYGAVFAEFHEAGASHRTVRIAAGKTATVYIPVASGQVAGAAPTIPLWSYLESDGLWHQEGTAVLQSLPGGLYYVGNTTHFSYINTDVAQLGDATCLRLRLDPTLVPAGLTLRVHIPTAPSYKQVQETAVDGDQFHALFRLPKNDTVTLELVDSDGNVIPGATQMVNLALRPPMTGSNLWPPYPYSECGEPILLGLTLPEYAEQSQGHPYFLTGPYGTFNTPSGVDAAMMTNAYYDRIDPPIAGPMPPMLVRQRDTLAGFWAMNGFTATGGGGTRAAYTNHNDLGFGRDMHCLANGSGPGTLACYVTNYGFPDQNPGNAEAARVADVTQAVATVAMELSPIDSSGDTTKVVKFYAYQGGAGTGVRLTAAALDAFGPKPVPQLCTVCHGGNYNPVDPLHPTLSEVNLQSSFREFDLQSFRFPPAGDVFPPTVPDGQGSLADFRSLNDMVKATLDPTSAIYEVITNWYPGVSNTPNFITPLTGWAGAPQDDLYRKVYATTCRTCHAARDGTLQFKAFSDFSIARGQIQATVCSSDKRMPNAVITYKNFWLSVPSRPGALAAFTTTGWPAIGTCH